MIPQSPESHPFVAEPSPSAPPLPTSRPKSRQIMSAPKVSQTPECAKTTQTTQKLVVKSEVVRFGEDPLSRVQPLLPKSFEMALKVDYVQRKLNEKLTNELNLQTVTLEPAVIPKVQHAVKEQFKLFDKGAAKDVWTKLGDTHHLLYTPREKGLGKIFHGKRRELRGEARIATKIQVGLLNKNLRLFLQGNNAFNPETRDRLVAILTKKFNSPKALIQEVVTAKTAAALANQLSISTNEAEQLIASFRPPPRPTHPNYQSYQNLIHSGEQVLQMTEVTEKEKVYGQDTFQTEKGIGNAEKYIRENRPNFQTSSRLGLDVLKGMRDMHAVGLVHGDMKLDNIIIYPTDKGGIRAKVSDFGKTKYIRPDESRLHSGNPRYASPEGNLSQKAEVYSSGLLLIGILESEFLTQEEPTLAKPTSSTGGAQAKRMGIEKFVLDNALCPQKEVSSIKGKISVYGRRGAIALTGIPSKRALEGAEKEVHRYIDALTQRLQEKHPEASSDKLKTLNVLLKTMTASDPKKRPTMQEAADSYEKIISELQ